MKRYRPWRSSRYEDHATPYEVELHRQNRGDVQDNPARPIMIYIPSDLIGYVDAEAVRRDIPKTWVWLDLLRAGMHKIVEEGRPGSGNEADG